jgi:hypothetical protein
LPAQLVRGAVWWAASCSEAETKRESMVAVRMEPEPLRNCLLFMSHTRFDGSLDLVSEWSVPILRLLVRPL